MSLRLGAIAGEMADRVRTFDWSSSPLGPLDRWTPALINAIALLLPAHAEIVMFWGPEYVALYNDAYSPTIGDKHPGALGRPASENWSELWSDLEPLLRGVRETGETYSAKDRPFYIERAGGIGENVYFDISYSAVREADGSVGGVLCIVSETTERVRAQQKAVADRERFAQMFAQAPSFMAQLDGPQHIYTLTNNAYQQLIGHRDVIGKSIRKALPELSGQGFYELLDEVYRSGKPFVGRAAPVALQRTAGGPLENVLLDFVYQPIQAADGAVTGIFVEGVDVTEQRTAEIAMRHSEERLRLATENAGVGLWDIDADGGIDFSYSRRSSPFIMDREKRVPMAHLLSRLHPDDAPRLEAAYNAARDPAQRTMMDVEYRVIPEENLPMRWVKIRGRGVFDSDGHCVRLSGTALDITKERETQEALRRSEEQLRLSTEYADVGLWDIDLVNDIVYWPPRVNAMFGMAPEQQVTMKQFRAAIHPDDRRQTIGLILDACDPKKRTLYSAEYRIVRKDDGGIRWLSAKGRAIFDDNGTCVRMLGIIQDITERKEIERQLNELNETLERRVAERTAALEKTQAALQQAQKMEAIGNLTGGISHDFNNLLQGITGSLDLIRRAPEKTERVKVWAEAGLQAAERGAKLTAQLLAFSRAQKLELKPLNLESLLNNVRDLLGRTLGPSVNVTMDLPPAPLAVLGDQTQLEMALLNLAINARDAMPEAAGDLLIRAHTLAVTKDTELPDGDYVELSVTDQGSGMAAEVSSRAFDPFFTTKEVGKGTGLGLSQVYGMARQAGGTARIVSSVGIGTTVSIILRATTAADRQESKARDAAVSPGAKAATILVVDDDAAVRDFLKESLDTLGYTVIAAESGLSALELLARTKPDAMIVDYAMPGMTGAELARRVRAKYPDMPITFASGYADTMALENVRDANTNLLRKPFRLDDLQQAIGRSLRPPA